MTVCTIKPGSYRAFYSRPRNLAVHAISINLKVLGQRILKCYTSYRLALLDQWTRLPELQISLSLADLVMTQLIEHSDYKAVILADTPLIDVRAPTEFSQGCIPGSQNLPLLFDSEREAVGKAYKDAGQEAAIKLGHQLVSGDMRQQRIQQWVDFLASNPDAMLLCFRGGLRSRISQQWLEDAGCPITRISGGYKAMRRYLMSVLVAENNKQFVIIGGKTGCDKTTLVNQLHNSIDLEGLARHRGSAFGSRVHPQPNQVNFENQMALSLLKQQQRVERTLFIEDECRAIGSLAIPELFYNKCQQAPLAVIEASIETRINNIVQDYVLDNYQQFQIHSGDNYAERFCKYLSGSLEKIKRRLGSELYQEINQDMVTALNSHLKQDNTEGHRAWVSKLLQHYYDPMYEYQLDKKLHRIVFRGTINEFHSWATKIA